MPKTAVKRRPKTATRSRPRIAARSSVKVAPKSRFATAAKNDLQMLRMLRDEIRLQSHLLRADARDRWDLLEQRWERLQQHLGRAGIAAGDAGREMDAAVSRLVDSLKSGYSSIKQALRS